MEQYTEKNTFVFREGNTIFKISELEPLELAHEWTKEGSSIMKYKIAYYDARFHETLGHVVYIWSETGILDFLDTLRDFTSLVVLNNVKPDYPFDGAEEEMNVIKAQEFSIQRKKQNIQFMEKTLKELKEDESDQTKEDTNV